MLRENDHFESCRSDDIAGFGVVNFNARFCETRRLEEKNGNFYQFDSILLTGKVDTSSGKRICTVGAPATSTDFGV